MSLRRPPERSDIERFVAGVAEVPARLRDELERRLETFCKQRGLDRGVVIEAAVERYLLAQQRPSPTERVRAWVGIVRELVTMARRSAARA